MAEYRLIEPSIEKLREVAFITHQMLFFEDQFKRYKDPKDEKEAVRYKEELGYWHKRNLEKVIK